VAKARGKSPWQKPVAKARGKSPWQGGVVTNNTVH